MSKFLIIKCYFQNISFSLSSEIVVDVDKDMPYDIVMTVVDLNYGAYGIYNFYKMQVLLQISSVFSYLIQ